MGEATEDGREQVGSLFIRPPPAKMIGRPPARRPAERHKDSLPHFWEVRPSRVEGKERECEQSATDAANEHITKGTSLQKGVAALRR